MAGRAADARETRAPRPAPWGLAEVLMVVSFSVLLSMLAGSLFSPNGYALCQMALSLVLTALVCAFAFLVARWAQRDGDVKLRDFGVVFDRVRGDIKYAAVLFLVLVPVLFVTGLLSAMVGKRLGVAPTEHPAARLVAESDRLTALQAALMAVIIVPPLEEYLFRGFIHGAFRTRFGVKAGLVAGAVFFAALHPGPLETPQYLLLGLALGWAYERTGSLIAPTALHAMNNLLAVVLVLLE